MLKRPHYIAAAALVLLTLIILNLPDRTATRLKLAIGSLFLPLFGLANSGQHLADKTGDALTPRSELIRENEALRREIEQLRIVGVQAERLAQENARLRQQLRWQEQSSWKSKLKLAQVVLHDPANWWRAVWINLGTRDGVRPNLPVLTGNGLLVGRISTVTLTRSQVLLLGDPNCKVAARIENEGRYLGIISAEGPLDGSLVSLDHIPKDATLKPGQNVVTSGEGEIFPKGIPIGKIVDFHPVEYGIYLRARVKLAANLSGLEEVWVLWP